MNTNDKPISCDVLISHLPGWLTDDLSTAERAAIEGHLANCPACQQELATSRQLWQQMGTVPTPQPGPQVRTQFYAMLDEFEAEEKEARSGTLLGQSGALRWIRDRFSPKLIMRLAYSALLLGVGVLVGYWAQRQRTPEVAYQQRVDTLTAQVQEMREMMMLSLLENPSATERLRAVSYTKDIDDTDSQVIDALLMTLNNDPNVNVRLVTLEALADKAQDARVREGLVQSLTRQESPLVQVALADVMVKLQEKRSLKSLRQLLKQPGTNELVKTKLEKTIRQLS
ncbi:zf-HC2 domain-containing protein [Fibrella forsythiae]|uniref:HEAT repeat domain-containing protein n=1 Tax=Fibrella forsythiae TaxID=2817061 RepID=A0ABS3JHL9_9BACT|nr:zf-HC2 domain-containing protein [Fibrella forsythiae]MBO0948392.1 HEAT repeat domain-containing protein [Fibrella forsythiae]